MPKIHEATIPRSLPPEPGKHDSGIVAGASDRQAPLPPSSTPSHESSKMAPVSGVLHWCGRYLEGGTPTRRRKVALNAVTSVYPTALDASLTVVPGSVRQDAP